MGSAPDRADPVARLADDLDVGLDAEEHHHAATEQLLVVDHDDTHRVVINHTILTAHVSHHGRAGASLDTFGPPLGSPGGSGRSPKGGPFGRGQSSSSSEMTP
jgi:hypothetical protein